MNYRSIEPRDTTKTRLLDLKCHTFLTKKTFKNTLKFQIENHLNFTLKLDAKTNN